MSGPKISAYELTGRARAIVFGQMRCEQQSIACAAKIQAELQSLRPFSDDFERQLENIRLLMKRTGDGTEQMDRIERLRESLRRDVKGIRDALSERMPQVSAKYAITEEAYAQKKEELKRLQALQKRVEKIKDDLDGALRQGGKIQAGASENREELNALRRDGDQNVKRIQRSIIDDLNGVYSFDFEDAPDTRIEEKKKALHSRLLELLRGDALPLDIAEEIKRAMVNLQRIGELQSLSTFDSITVSNLQKKVDAYKRDFEQRKAAFEELTERYKALCTMTGEDAKALPFGGGAEAEIAAEIERLEGLLVRQQEQAYIAETVDEVMAEMGYDLIGTREVRKKSGKRFRNELFTFDEGTAVNVTFASDGQISMELGGIGREDRVPTEEETDVLTHAMESFCGEFAEFERKLRERGIVVGNRIALSPPSAEYAAMININDYDVRDDARIDEMNAGEKRRRPAEKKVMRRDC